MPNERNTYIKTTEREADTHKEITNDLTHELQT